MNRNNQRVCATEEHDQILKLLPIVWIQLEETPRQFLAIVFTVSGRRQHSCLRPLREASKGVPPSVWCALFKIRDAARLEISSLGSRSSPQASSPKESGDGSSQTRAYCDDSS